MINFHKLAKEKIKPKDDENFFCKICEKEVLFGGHIKYHNENIVKCPTCGKIFPTYQKGWFEFVFLDTNLQLLI